MTIQRIALIEELRSAGFGREKARKIVETIFRSMTQALRRGEQVHTPIGSFIPGRPTPFSAIHEVVMGNQRVRKVRLVRYRRRRATVRFEPKID